MTDDQWERVDDGRWEHGNGYGIAVVDGFDSGAAQLASDRYRVVYREPDRGSPTTHGTFGDADAAHDHAAALTAELPQYRVATLDDYA